MKFLVAALVAAFSLASFVPQALAGANLCGKAYNVRVLVIKKHGKRAPGRNICRYGVRFKWVSADGERRHWGSRDAKITEKRAYLRQLRALIRPTGYPLHGRPSV